MAKARANCKCEVCGREFTKERKFHNRSEANNWEKWAEGNYTLCTECYRAEELKEAQETTKDLPELTGSPKQIDWATKIRAEKAAEIKGFVERHKFAEDKKEQGHKLVDYIFSQTESTYWIDNRYSSAMTLMQEALKEIV